MSDNVIDNKVIYGDVSVGQKLPELSVDLTTKLIVATAIATRDYQDVHHDQDRARELGSPNIFMNILTTNGFVGRYVTDWTGPTAELKNVSIKLGAPNYPGDTMVFSGEVVEKDDSAQTVKLAVVGKNSMGNHVNGSVTVQLPSQ